MLCFVNFDKRKCTWCKFFAVSNCPRCQIVRFYPWCQIVRGVKLSWCQIVRCQIVRVSYSPWRQIVLGVKLSAHVWIYGMRVKCICQFTEIISRQSASTWLKRGGAGLLLFSSSVPMPEPVTAAARAWCWGRRYPSSPSPVSQARRPCPAPLSDYLRPAD